MQEKRKKIQAYVRQRTQVAGVKSHAEHCKAGGDCRALNQWSADFWSLMGAGSCVILLREAVGKAQRR